LCIADLCLCLCLCLAVACDSRTPERGEPGRTDQAGNPTAAPPAPPPPDPDALPPAADLPPERRAVQVVHGTERVVDAEQARGRGLTLVDLSDGWAPAIFQDGTAADGSPLPNRYRPIYDGLASDRTDGDGQPLRPGERNFLELYGIPPSLSALHGRFLADGDRPCFAQVDTARLLAVPSIPSWGSASEKKELARAKERADRLAQSAGAIDAGVEALAATDPKLAKELKAHQQFEAERAAFTEAEKRLACEGLLDGASHIPGSYDTPMRFAMLAFQRKNVVMAEADITRGTLEALARSPLDNAFLALQRVLAERAADAGGFIEDGSAGGRDLVGEATAAVMARLGVQTPEQALAFFRRRRPEDFTWLRAAVRLPEAPSYYGAHMDLVGEIDRGDVWYDFPFDGKGQRLPQPRSRYPSFTLYVREAGRGGKDGKKLPLVRWRTTIGSWRTELASDGQEYLRYKDSDVGPRVWRHVVAAPVWVPYGSSPVGGMVKEKWVNGVLMKVTNYDEVGPGYLSAYGLVAGIHVEPRSRGFFDNGIRTHGTFDYTSLRGRFSHGCHRLQNNLAVRMFSFVIRHRRHKVLGQMALDARRSFWWQGEVFDLRLPTRGYYYELEPPLPVETLPGQIKGKLQKPVAGYVRKPGEVYTASSPPAAPGGPEAKAGGAGAAAGEP
jgi:hypothetical protein